MNVHISLTLCKKEDTLSLAQKHVGVTENLQFGVWKFGISGTPAITYVSPVAITHHSCLKVTLHVLKAFS